MITKSNNYYFIPRDNEETLKLPSVTHILSAISKPALITWAARVTAEAALDLIPRGPASVEQITRAGFSKRDNAADRGSEIHRYISEYLKGDKPNINPDFQGYFDGFLSFWSSFKSKLLFTEQVCYSVKYGYAGTTDLGIEVTSGEKWLLDFKTGRVYRETGLQLKAYAEALAEMGIAKMDKCFGIQLMTNGTFSIVPADAPFEVFLATKRLWEWQKNYV